VTEANAPSPAIARPADLDALQAAWRRADGGEATFVRLQAPFGGGRRALVGELLRTVAQPDLVAWRLPAQEHETGVAWLVRAWGGLVGPLAHDAGARGRVEAALNGQLAAQTKRVQGWYEGFVTAVREAKVDATQGQVQLRVPQDNPLLALAEVTLGIARKLPVLLEFQAPQLVHSVAFAAFVETLMQAASAGSHRLMVVLYDEPASDLRNSTYPAPLLELLGRRAASFTDVVMAPWSADDLGAWLASIGRSTEHAATLARLSDGRLGFAVELSEAFEADSDLAARAATASLADLVPTAVDADDLDEAPADQAADKPRHATADDARVVLQLAALVGQIFPSGLVAEMGGFTRDSVDDLLDAMGGLFEEVQYHEQMATWLYRFKRGTWREGLLASFDTEADRDLTRRVAMYMERFLVPRGPAFMAHTARTWAQAHEYGRAGNMRAVTLTNDAADAWGMTWDLMRAHPEVDWQPVLKRSVWTTLLDHLVQTGSVAQAEAVTQEAQTWADANQDAELQAWLLLNTSKLSGRRQDFLAARQQAASAITAYDTLGNRNKVAEVWAHLAQIELGDEKTEAALQAVDQAIAFGSREDGEGRTVVQPSIVVTAELVRGAAARQAGQLDQAIQHFRQANEVAGAVGLAPQALEAGVGLGEATLAAGKPDEARQILSRVMLACRQVGALPRERNAAQLLAQIEGRAGKFAEALELSKRVLQITQQLRFDAALPVDLFNVGFYTLTQNKGAEALPFFEGALQRLAGQDANPLLRDLLYYAGIASLQAGKVDAGKAHLERALPILSAAGDARKLLSSLDNLGRISAHGGNKVDAKGWYEKAIEVANQAGLKDERRDLQKRLDGLGV
jgi:tetratricopeptide (TPR) repeat protein